MVGRIEGAMLAALGKHVLGRMVPPATGPAYSKSRQRAPPTILSRVCLAITRLTSFRPCWRRGGMLAARGKDALESDDRNEHASPKLEAWHPLNRVRRRWLGCSSRSWVPCLPLGASMILNRAAEANMLPQSGKHGTHE